MTLQKFRALFLLAVAASKPKIQARGTCKFRLAQTIYAAKRLHADRLTSSCPTRPALGRQQACTPPQPICQNAAHQGERQAGQERQGQQLHAPQLETTPEHLMEGTGSIGATVQNRSTSPKNAYTDWIQAIQHRWILEFDTQIFFSSLIQKTELVLQIKNSTRILWDCPLKTSFGEV